MDPELQHFILHDGPMTLSQLELVFEFLRKHRDIRLSLYGDSEGPLVSHIIPEFIAEVVKRCE